MQILGMAEMERIFEVVDDLEISREAIQVELLPAGEGEVELAEGGKLRIVLPERRPLEAWLPELRRRLDELAPPAARESGR